MKSLNIGIIGGKLQVIEATEGLKSYAECLNVSNFNFSTILPSTYSQKLQLGERISAVLANYDYIIAIDSFIEEISTSTLDLMRRAQFESPEMSQKIIMMIEQTNYKAYRLLNEKGFSDYSEIFNNLQELHYELHDHMTPNFNIATINAINSLEEPAQI